MRERAMIATGLLAVLTFAAGCSGASGVNTEDPTTMTASTAASTATSSVVSTSSPATASRTTKTLTVASSTSQTTGAEVLSPREAADRTAIARQWAKFWQVYLVLPHTPEKDRHAMAAAVAVEPGLTNLLTDAKTVAEKGWDSYGQITHRISWPQPVNGKATAVIADCQDTSQAGSVETSTGNKMTVGVERNSLQGALVRGEDGVWRVQKAFYLKDEPC